MTDHISVLYEDPAFAVLYKPAGVLMHADNVKLKAENLKRERTIADWVVEHYPETKTVGDEPATRPGIVHRLDKETSGVLLIARTQDAFGYFKKLFQSHGVVKTYLALAAGFVATGDGVIDKPIGLVSGTVRHTVHVARAKMVKPAVTRFYTLTRYEGEGKNYTLLSVEPLTGRTHQIRVHLASIGHPVVGDALYGKAHLPHVRRQFLHAESLAFTAPSGERLTVSADLPQDLAQALTQLNPLPATRGQRS